jgi:hypothetical protein
VCVALWLAGSHSPVFRESMCIYTFGIVM